jgi:hypothetical protein
LQDSSSSGGSRDGTTPFTLLDDCQDDINVCPYLAFTGLCGSDSLWIVTQCPRSCKKCSPSVMTGGAGWNLCNVHFDGVTLTQQLRHPPCWIVAVAD